VCRPLSSQAAKSRDIFAHGRLQPFDLLDFKKFEGLLSVKAVIQNLAPETRLTNDH